VRKRLTDKDNFLNSENTEQYDKIFNALQKNGVILSIIYDEKQYSEFKKSHKKLTGINSDAALHKYKNPEPNQKYVEEGFYIFPVCISICSSGNIGHQGATSVETFEDIVLRDGYEDNLKIPLDVIINFDNYPEYDV